MIAVSIDRHAGAGWEDWSAYVFPVTDVQTESQARAGSGPSTVRFVDPPAIPLKNWGLRVADDEAVTIANPDGVTFEGTVDGVKHSDEDQPGSPVVHVITAGDYSDLLEFDVVPRCWRSAVETDKERITWLIETFGTHGVTCGDEVQAVIGSMPGGADGRPEQEFGPSSLAEAIGKVLALTGGQVYVDYQKRAHHFIDETITAPFNLSDDPNGTTTREYFDFTLDEDNVTKVDEVVVFGAQLAEGAGLLTVTRTAPDAPAAEYRRRVSLVDDKLTSVALAEAAGDAFLQVHRGRRSGTLQTIHPGLLGGQTVQITHAAQGLTAEPFRIHSVKPTIDTPAGAVYAVAFGDAPPSQVDIIAGTGGLASQAASAAATAIAASRTMTDLSVGGANLVANSSFGSAILATWTAGAEWVFGYSPVDPEVAMWGSKTARATLAAATAGELVTRLIPVYRLDDYWATAWTFLRARTSGTVRVELREYDSGDALLVSTIIADLTAVESDYTARRVHMGPNDELGRTGFDADTVGVRLAIYTTGASTLALDVGGVQIERGRLATAYAPAPSELADGSIDAGTKLIAYSIVAGLVAAGTLTADKFAATLAWVSTLIAGTPGAARVELDPNGLRLYNSADVLQVNFPTLTANAYFSGDIQATSLTLVGAGEIRGAMSLTKAAVLTAQAGVQPPNAPPVLSQGLLSVPLAVTGGWAPVGHGYYDPAAGSTGAIPCFVGVEYNGAPGISTTFRVTEWELATGAVSRTTILTGQVHVRVDSVARFGANWYVLGWDGAQQVTLLRYTRATGAFGSGACFASYFRAGVTGTRVTADATYLYILGPSTSGITERVVAVSPATLTYWATIELALPTPPTGADYIFLSGFTVADIGDGHSNCFWVDLIWHVAGLGFVPGEIYQFLIAGTPGALVAATDWPSASAYADRGLVWDGVNFREANGTTLHLFSNWLPASGDPYWVSYSWLDDVGTTHETPVGPRASITVPRRRFLGVTTSVIPVGGADDPNKARVYVAQGATDPGPGHYKLQVTDGWAGRTLTTYNSGGAADGGGTAFTGAIGAQITTPGGLWNIRGNDTGSIPPVVAVAAVAGQVLAPASVAATGAIYVTLTGNANNWAPAGWGPGVTLIDVTLGAARTITGMTGASAGRIVVIRCADLQNLTLSNNDAASSFGNRFLCSGYANAVVPGYGSVILVGYGTTGWIVHKGA